MTNEHPSRRAGTVDPSDVAQARQGRRRRTLYASLAGWALLGAASTGIVACGSNATTASGTSTPAAPATTSAAGAPATAGSSAAAANTTAPGTASPSAAATSTAGGSADASPAGATATEYKDGTYTATGTYQSPGGQESVEITLTIADDKITDATGKSNASRPQSVEYQGQFLGNFAGLIVGKSVDQVSLDKVAGSSLTSGGFEKALQTIKTDAKA